MASENKTHRTFLLAASGRACEASSTLGGGCRRGFWMLLSCKSEATQSAQKIKEVDSEALNNRDTLAVSKLTCNNKTHIPIGTYFLGILSLWSRHSYLVILGLIPNVELTSLHSLYESSRIVSTWASLVVLRRPP